MTSSEVRREAGVAILTRQTARTLWPDGSAIGRALWTDFDTVKFRTVVGVVDDIQFGGVGEAPGLHLFMPWTQDSASARIYALVKTTGSAATVALGVAIALALARTFRALLFGIEPIDPVSLTAGGAALLVVALAAALGPARRASRVDPALALRVD